MDELLHPFIVHLPLGLAILAPLLILLLAVLDGKGKLTPSAWLVVLLVQVLITAGSLAALKSGEGEEELVERSVPEAALHQHEEAAELFLWSGVAGLVLAAVMVLPLGAGLRRVVPFLLLGLSLVTLALGLRTGKAGGELVYQHQAGAARAGLAFPEADGAAKPVTTPGQGVRDHD
jgi:uncharacterized membrane protein